MGIGHNFALHLKDKGFRVDPVNRLMCRYLARAHRTAA